VSKRVRGQVRSHRRPGARPPTERSASRPRNPAPRSLAPARESQLEVAEIIAEDALEDGSVELQPAPGTRSDGERGRSSQRLHHKIKAGSVLAARATTEYVYVAQDMRRILFVAGGLIGLLFALWVLVVLLKVVALPFY
jgi:hypothetical protein